MMLSDSVLCPTGFANQTRELAKRLSKDKDFEITHVGHNYIGKNLIKAVCEDGEEINYKILTGTTRPYAQDALPQYFYNHKPDMFWVLLDTFMLYPWIFNMPFTFKSVMYYPSDGGGFPKGCENVLRKFSHPVAMSKYAQKQIEETFNIKTHYIPHATNTDSFFKLSDEQRANLKVRFGIPPNAIVFGDVARNQGRKNMPATIIAFKRFMELNPTSNAYLFLHTDVNDVAAHTNLADLARTLGIGDRVKFSGMNFFSGFTLKDMNDIYNVMDIRISTTTGEGFGICTIESMACEIPNVITNYTTTQELVTDHNAGLTARVAHEVMGTWDVMRGFVDEKDMAEKMTILYKDENLRKKFGMNGRIAVKKYYDWDGPNGVAEIWKNYIRRTVSS
jgi:glycosyltransferase involved in cell wall biosynthesis